MEDVYVKATKAKFESIKGTLHLDFDRFPVPATDISQPLDAGYAEQKYFETTRHLKANATYTQQVN